MKVKCKIPFAKQAVTSRTPHLGKPNKGNSCSKAENPPLQADLKKKKPTRQGKERTLQEVLNKLPENPAHFVKMQLELHSRKKREEDTHLK